MNQILVVHSRWVYNFMGIILEAQVSSFFRFYAFLSKIGLRYWWISNPIWWNKVHRESTTCKWVCDSVRWMEAFVANLGHPLWGSQSMQDLASLMRKAEHSSFQMLIPALTASPIKDDPDLQWMPLFISHTHLHACFLYVLSSTYKHTYIQTYIQTFICVYMHATCIHIHTYIHTYIYFLHKFHTPHKHTHIHVNTNIHTRAHTYTSNYLKMFTSDFRLDKNRP